MSFHECATPHWALAVKRAITGFYFDTHGDPVADLDCGHGQHVRHRPPFFNRPWVTSHSGREAMTGALLDCVRCVQMEWPDDCVPYHRTAEFNELTIPAGLTSHHATKRGVWARIHVISGFLTYSVGEPVNQSFRVAAESSAVVVPEVPHRVIPEGPVRFFVEFSRVHRH